MAYAARINSLINEEIEDSLSSIDSNDDRDEGGFQLEFVSISRVINHMTSFKFSALIGWNYSIKTGEQILYRLFFLRSIAQFFTHIYMNCFVSS